MSNTEKPDDETPYDEKPDVEYIREDAQFYFDRLIDLFKESHPRGGEDTKTGKLEMARNALEISWRLQDCIAVWAQAQVVGYCIYKDEQELLDFLSNKASEQIDENSHILEALGMQWSPHNGERVNRAFPDMGDWLEEWQKATGQDGIIGNETLRSIISEMMMSRSYNSSFWRINLQHMLQALNEGEVKALAAPIPFKRQGQPYSLKQCRACAIMHVAFLNGKGMKKYRALEKISDALAVSPETLRTWEKSLKQDEDAANNIYCAELAAQFVDYIKKSRFAGGMGLDRTKYGKHRGAWNLHTAHFIYKKVLSRPLKELRKDLNQARQKQGTRNGS